MVGTVKDAKKAKQLAETTIPNALLYGGIVLFVLGVILAIVGHRRGKRLRQSALPPRPSPSPPTSP